MILNVPAPAAPTIRRTRTFCSRSKTFLKVSGLEVVRGSSRSHASLWPQGSQSRVFVNRQNPPGARCLRRDVKSLNSRRRTRVTSHSVSCYRDRTARSRSRVDLTLIAGASPSWSRHPRRPISSTFHIGRARVHTSSTFIYQKEAYTIRVPTLQSRLVLVALGCGLALGQGGEPLP